MHSGWNSRLEGGSLRLLTNFELMIGGGGCVIFLVNICQ